MTRQEMIDAMATAAVAGALEIHPADAMTAADWEMEWFINGTEE